MKKLWLMLMFPLVVCTDTNGVVIAPYKSVTNTLSFTNAVTNIQVTQVNHYFKTTNRFDGYAMLSRVPGGEWKLDGWSPSTHTNWIIGAQSPSEYLIWLLNKPAAPAAIRLMP